MLKNHLLIFMLSLMPMTGSAWDKYDQDALNKTQQLLQNTSERNREVQKDEKARKADAFVDKVTKGNSAVKEDIYGLASSVFEKLARDANGDGEKMQQQLQKFLEDPESFYSQWSPEEKAKFREIIEQIENGNRSVSSGH